MDVTLPDSVVGRLLDRRYQVGQRIARGGMAAVHEGLDTRLDRPIALKIMHPDLAADHEFVHRFIDEARHAARLSRHPNVVAVYDQGETDGLVWIAMELVRGRTLRAILRERRRLDAPTALGVLEPVLSALAAAHRESMIHRDVKPENVLVGDDGRVQVTDFGLARAASSNSTATRGLLLGTVAYIAPEQALGRQASTASDVYSAGILLFELLTGHAPHQGPTDYVIVRKHVDDDVPAPTSEVSALPVLMDELVARATARDPAQRYPDAGAFLRDVVRARRLLRADLRQARTPAAGSGQDSRQGRTEPAGDAVNGAAQDKPWLALSPANGLEPLDQAGVSMALALDAATWESWSDGHGPLTFSRSEPDADPDLQQTSVIRSHQASDEVSDSPTDSQAGSRPPAEQATPASPARDSTWADRRSAARAEAGRFSRSDTAPTDVVITDLEEAQVDDQAGYRRRRWWRRRGVVSFLLVLVLAAGAAWAGWWYMAGRYIATPDLTRLSVAEASGVATKAGLVVAVEDGEFSETVAPDEVVRTTPEAGAPILPDGTVGLVLSKGPERFDVPSLVGMTQQAAGEALAANELAIGAVTDRYDDEAPIGEVLEQAIEPGAKVRRDAVVDLVVSKGREPVELADWTGKKLDAARKALTNDELKVQVKEVFSDSVAVGVVVAQQPGAGEVFKKDTVTLTVSKGPEFVTVPRVEGQSVQAARSALAAVGLSAKTTLLLPAGPGNVLRQSPSEGRQVRSGSTITLYVF